MYVIFPLKCYLHVVESLSHLIIECVSNYLEKDTFWER